MVGILVHIVIGIILFTPIGFLAGYLQDKHAKDKAEEEKRNRLQP